MINTHTSELTKVLSTTYRKKNMLRYLTNQKDWQQDSGETLSQKIMAAAQGLSHFKVQRGECVGIYSQNMPQCIYCEMGMFTIGAVSVPIYATCSPEQVHFIARDARVRLIFVGSQFEYNNAYHVQSTQGQIEQIIVFDQNVVKNPKDTTTLYYNEFISLGNSMPHEAYVKSQMGDGLMEDLAILIYTSGTTGIPKGVQITHKMILTQVKAHHELFPYLGSKDVSVNFLPLSHVFEKLWVYFCLTYGLKVVVVTNPKEIMTLMPQIKPTVMCNVPRYWEKVYQGVREHIERSPRFMTKIYNRALRIGEKYYLEYRNQGRSIPFLLSLQNDFYQRTIFYLLKRVLGLHKGRFYPTAGAPLAIDINRFLHAAGFNIVVGYGLTETAATVSVYRDQGFVLSSIGEPLNSVNVRIDPNTNEIQVKGDSITPGYYNNPQANAEAFTEDGWFRTGDAGRMEGNTLFFVERIKELFKTSNGKYIAPQQIENTLIGDSYFEQVAVIADERKYVSALIFPNWQKLQKTLFERNVIPSLDIPPKELASNKQIIDMVMAHIEKLQSHLANFEKIKKITLITEPFTIENGLLTNTLKLKRKNIMETYAREIDLMYL